MGNIEVIEKTTEEVIMPFEKNEEFFVEDLGEIAKKPFYSFLKRATDIFVSFFGLILLGIPMLIVALIVRLTPEGPAFFVPDRFKDGGSYETVSGYIRKLDPYTHSVILRDGTRIDIDDLVSIRTKARYE